jgi:hypothetical protein
MKPNEIIGTLGLVMWSSAMPLLFWHGELIIMILQLSVGIFFQVVFLSWWGLETFNSWFK